MEEAFVDRVDNYNKDEISELRNCGILSKYGFETGDQVRFEKINDKKYKVIKVKSIHELLKEINMSEEEWSKRKKERLSKYG